MTDLYFGRFPPTFRNVHHHFESIRNSIYIRKYIHGFTQSPQQGPEQAWSVDRHPSGEPNGNLSAERPPGNGSGNHSSSCGPSFELENRGNLVPTPYHSLITTYITKRQNQAFEIHFWGHLAPGISISHRLRLHYPSKRLVLVLLFWAPGERERGRERKREH